MNQFQEKIESLIPHLVPGATFLPHDLATLTTFLISISPSICLETNPQTHGTSTILITAQHTWLRHWPSTLAHSILVILTCPSFSSLAFYYKANCMIKLVSISIISSYSQNHPNPPFIPYSTMAFNSIPILSIHSSKYILHDT